MSETNYLKHRGKCKEMSEALIAADPTLTLVRGFYHEPIWGTKEQHWWCKKPDGTIVDPTSKQFPAGGIVDCYEEFDGTSECCECGKRNNADEMQHEGRYSYCGYDCYCKFVGVAA
jgi:hypothetical protein